VTSAWVVMVAALGGIVDLSGDWSFRHGDDTAWADPAFHDDWARVQVPGSWPASGDAAGEIGWYRLRVPASRLPDRSGLALEIGGVYSAYELYAGGERIGGIGRLPPDPRIAYGTRGVFPLPAITDGEDVLIALRVYHPATLPQLMAGVSTGPVRIGPTDVLTREAERRDLPILILAVMFLAVAGYHLHLWVRRRHLESYLHFGILSILTGLYVAGRTDLPADVLGWDLAKRIQLATQMLAPVAFAWFTLHFTGRAVPRWVRLFAGASAAGAAGCFVLPVVSVVLVANYQALALFAMKIWLVYLVIHAVRNDVPESRLLAFGVLAVVAGTIHDTLVFSDVLHTPFVVPYAYAVLVGTMAISLSNRFVRVYQEVDELNRDLEKRVADRTAELASLNADLEGRVRQQVTEILRRSRLERYFSRQLLDRVLGEEEDLPSGAERAWITLLFADLAGFTALSDRLPPEVVHRLLDAFLGAMIEVVEGAGATLDKLMGDGVMVLVGAPDPLTPEAQARTAVSLGIVMQHRLAALREKWREEGIDAPLDLRVGIHHDSVTVGHFGTDELQTYTAIGKGVNLASRLEGACPPGHVLVSREVRDLFGDAFPTEGPRHLDLKGISGKVEAFVVRVDTTTGTLPESNAA
jgi:class 3 adenylate cyclase